MADMTIYDTLKHDHDELKPMLAQLAEGNQDPLTKATMELRAHTEAEERVFYQRLETQPDMKDLIAEGYKEHREADRLANELKQMTGEADRFRSKAMELKDAVGHHIQEEEGEVFQRARQFISEDEARLMATDFERQKQATPSAQNVCRAPF